MLTIVVDSFDGYSDLWTCFFSIFTKYWEKCPYDVKLVSNYKKFTGIETINVGEETCWSDRTIKAIEQIDTEYILLLLEDYLLGEPVKTEDVEKALSFVKRNKARYLRLTNIPSSRFYDDEEIFPLYADEEYAVNLQAAIWEKQFLLESLHKYSGNAWDFEIGFLKAAVDSEHIIMEGCFGIKKDPLHIHNGVLKGKWFPKEIKYFTKRGVNVLWQERGKLSFIQATKYYLSIWIKNKLSYSMRKRVKAILKRIGVKFASDL